MCKNDDGSTVQDDAGNDSTSHKVSYYNLKDDKNASNTYKSSTFEDGNNMLFRMVSPEREDNN